MEEQTNEQSEELEELDLFVWSEEDLAKPLEQSPKFDYMKSIGDNFKKIEEKDTKFNTAINNKVDKQEGKDLSTNDFTNTYKQKLDELQNYDDTEVVQEIRKLQQENTELRKTQDDMIEKQLNAETEADTSVIAKDTDEFYGKLSLFGGQRQETSQGTSNLAVLEEGNHVSGNVIITVTNGIVAGSGTNNTDTTIILKIGTVYLKKDKMYYYNKLGDTTGQGAYLTHNGQKFFGKNEERSFVATADEECSIYVTVGAGQTPTGRAQILISETSGDTWMQGKKQIPSLQYPSEIEAVGDNVNLFNKDTISENKYINLGNGVLGNSTTSNTSDYIKVSADEEYVLSYEYETLFATGKRVCCYFDENKNYIKGIEYTSTNKETVFLSNQNGYIRFSYDINAYNVKLEKGTKLTSYSEFGQGSVEISTSNKNIAEINQKDWELTENNTIKNKSVTENKDLLIKKIKLKKGQVLKTRLVLFSKPLNSTTFTAYLNNRATVCQVLNYTNINNNEFELNKAYDRTYTAIEDCEIFYVCWGNANNDISEFQFSASIDDNDLKYVVHKSKEYTLQTQQKMFEGDTFEQVDGVWYEKHDKGEYVLDGVNNKAKYLSATNSIKINIADAIKAATYYTNQKDLFLLCTHFIHSKKNLSNYGVGEIVYWDTQGDLYMKAEEGKFANLNEVNSWLKEQYDAGTPMTIAYQRIQPLLLKCTAEQCKILDKMDTYRDGTIITTDNDLCKISLRYKEDYGKRITALEKQISIATTVAE